MKKMVFIAILSVLLLIGGCGTEGTDGRADDSSAEQDNWGAIKNVSDRDIIAELKQTVEESPQRELASQEQLTSMEYTEGFFGDPSKELEEDMTVQAIEGPAAIEAVQKVYGGDDGFDKEGVLFFENQQNGATQSGVWIGLKAPDERLQQVLDILQQKGEGERSYQNLSIFSSVRIRRLNYMFSKTK
ncbi:hypothetical protein DVB69_00115 [Sporosarcina sp. BI001-red]|uniref:hypothetical protein n=1 Tax=Sporosarcina sp. BI001-red TaxID=2282866 RepID=UPI000E25B9A1|nr:hypothetical protein [Sporosarcina sp. BI001-red]REB11586.1 hypothetical protein DVB69_00115 [Sporosarcina sp. BI001-red]